MTRSVSCDKIINDEQGIEQNSLGRTLALEAISTSLNTKIEQDENVNQHGPCTLKGERSTLPLQESTIPNKRHKSQKVLDSSSKLDQNGHFPLIDKSRRVRCKYEKCGRKSFVSCIKCKVNLCVSIPEVRNCFANFHNDQSFDATVNSIEQHKTEKMPELSIRFDQTGHSFNIDKSRQVRCKLEKCGKKSYIFCTKCKVHLCLNIQENRNCFADFHSLKYQK